MEQYSHGGLRDRQRPCCASCHGTRQHVPSQNQFWCVHIVLQGWHGREGGCENRSGLAESVVAGLAGVGFHSSLATYLFKMEEFRSSARHFGLQSRLGYSVAYGLKGHPHPECLTAFFRNRCDIDAHRSRAGLVVSNWGAIQQGDAQPWCGVRRLSSCLSVVPRKQLMWCSAACGGSS